jgi:membrane protein YqaA with SNARE-associated domain
VNDFRGLLAAALLSLGPWAPFAISLLDSAFVPLAHSVDLLIAVVAAASPERAYLAAAMSVAGSTLGSLILYEISRRGGRVVLEKHFAPKTIERIRGRMERYGALMLALPTMIPGPLPMRPMVIAAGVFRMRRLRFVAVLAAARAIRFFAIAIAAVHYGEPAAQYLNGYGMAGLAASALACASLAAWKRFGPRSRRKSECSGGPPRPPVAAPAQRISATEYAASRAANC